MKHRPSQLPGRLLAAAAVCAASALLFAQLPHQTGIFTGQVNPQVNTALYGGGVPASVKYANAGSTSTPMQSELRYAYWKSGALPSDIRMGYAQIGPMNPQGPMAVIDAATPNYMPVKSTAPPAAMGSAAFSGGGSVRYSSSPAPSAAYVPPRSVSPALVSQGPINSGPINGGAIRYGR